MHDKPRRIIVNYISSEYKIKVFSDYLRINYTKDYIKLLTGLNDKQSMRVLYWMKETFNEYEGITISKIIKLGEGVKSNLL